MSLSPIAQRPSTPLTISSLATSWPVVAAIATSIMYLCGFAFFHAVSRALGLDSLRISVAKEEQLVRGLALLTELVASGVVGLAMVATIALPFCYLPERIRRAVSGIGRPLYQTRSRNTRPIIVILLGLAGVCFAAFLVRSLEEFDRIPLLDSPPQLFFDYFTFLSDNDGQATGMSLLIAWPIWAWAIASLYAWMELRSSLFKRISGFYLAIVALGLILDWSGIVGVASTITTYPIIGGPDLEQIAKGSLCLRLGADDKDTAVLVITPTVQGNFRETKKVLLYLPNSSARWWQTSDKKPLYRYAFMSWAFNKAKEPH